LTLIGDSVDNIPGVEKVGPKTAAKWLQQFGTLDNVLAHAGDIGGVVGDNLRKARDWLPTARELLRVKSDLALPGGIADLAPSAPDQPRTTQLFDEHDVQLWCRELGEVETPSSPRPERDYQTILSLAELEGWLDRIASAGVVCVDVQTSKKDAQAAR